MKTDASWQSVIWKRPTISLRYAICQRDIYFSTWTSTFIPKWRETLLKFVIFNRVLSWLFIFLSRHLSELNKSQFSTYTTTKNCQSCETNTPWQSSRRSRPSFLRKLVSVLYQTCSAYFNPYKTLRRQQTGFEYSSSRWGCSMYMILWRNFYKKGVTTSICRIL